MAHGWHIHISMVANREINGLHQLWYVHFDDVDNSLLSACRRIAPAIAANWSIKGRAMYYFVCMLMHVKHP